MTTMSRGRTWARAAAMVVAMALVAAACGGDDDGEGGGASTSATTGEGASASTTVAGASTTAAAPDDVDPDGVLRVGIGLLDLSWDPANPIPPRVHSSPQVAVYDTLLHSIDGQLEPGLAEDVSAVDPQTVKITLRPNMVFTDGSPLDANAAKRSLEYIVNSANTSLEGERKYIASITVEDAVTLTLHLNTPGAGGLMVALAGSSFLIVSPKALDDGVDLKTTAVGAGPFMLQEFQPGVKAVMVRNPDYWDADNIKLAGVEWVNVEAAANANALRSGTVDVVDLINFEQASGLAGGPIKVEPVVTGNSVMWAYMCKSRPPFDNLKVRQALNYAIDRQAINTSLWQGKGKSAWGFWPEGSPYYSSELDGYYEFDQAKAKALLAEAGQPSLTFDAYFTQTQQRAAEIVQAQLAAVGVTMNITPLVSPGDFYSPTPKRDFNLHLLDRAYIQKVARALEPGSVSNICQWNDPELLAGLAAIRAAEPGSPEAIAAWARTSKQALASAAMIFVAFAPSVKVWNDDRIGDAAFMDDYAGKPVIDFYHVYIKK